jgi:hypothetical protein
MSMPRSLARIALLCFALFTLGAAAAHGLAQGQPKPFSYYWSAFGFADCAMPCYLGIVPGETAFREAAGIVAERLPTYSSMLTDEGSQVVFFGVWQGSSQTVSGLVRNRRGLVGEVRITLNVPLVEVVLEFGPPQCVMLYPQRAPSIMYLYWDDGEIMHWASVTLVAGQRIIPRISYETPVFTIATSALEAGNVCSGPSAATPPQANARLVPWRGFAPLWRYQG